MEPPACQTKAAVVSDALVSNTRTLALCLQDAFDSREDRCRTEDGQLLPDCTLSVAGA